jgi:hypothetical protein
LKDRRERAMEAAGKSASGMSEVSAEHDKHLVEALNS